MPTLAEVDARNRARLDAKDPERAKAGRYARALRKHAQLVVAEVQIANESISDKARADAAALHARLVERGAKKLTAKQVKAYRAAVEKFQTTRLAAKRADNA